MSQEAVHGFIDKINQDIALYAIVTRAAAEEPDLDLVKLAGEHGFAFTREEGLNVWADILASGELPDALLEAVAGGNPINCSDESKGG